MARENDKPSFGILGYQETCYFSNIPESVELGQWIMIRIENQIDHTLKAAVRIEAEGRSADSLIDMPAGTHEYRCFAPRLASGSAGTTAARLTITAEGRSVSALVGAGHFRPWTIHLLSDDCPDYTWGYSTELSYLADSAAVTEAELRVAEAFSSEPTWNRNRYSFAVAREVQFYEQSHDEAENRKLFSRIRDGSFSVNPIPTMSLSCSQGLEDMIRGLYVARGLERKHGIKLAYANHQETPTAAWALASVLVGSGIPYLVKGILPFGTPWTARLEEPPVFFWDGPDGARLLVRRHNLNYNEGAFVLRDLAAITQTVERRLVPEYESRRATYPFCSIGLVGCYSDLNADTRTYALRKATGIAQYNAQGWDYPRIVNSSHELFWDEIERERSGSVELPVRSGDYGTSWEVWLLTLAGLFARWRRLQERGPLADRMSAIAQAIDSGWIAEAKPVLERGWDDLTSLSDHAWNGADEPNRRLNLSLRRRWAGEAETSFDQLISRALSVVARHASAVSQADSHHEAALRPDADRLPAKAGWEAALVMNGLGWERSAVASIDVAEPDGAVLVDAATGAQVPAQLCRRGGRAVLDFQANELPPLGYRLFLVQRGAASPEQVSVRGRTIESPHHRLEVDSRSGGIRSLYSKTLGRELVHPGGELNRWTYRHEGRDEEVECESIEPGASGPVYGEIHVRTRSRQLSISTTVRLYAGTDRIEIRDEVSKPITSDRQSLHFVFPFDVPRGRF
jgi:alpha-mannosidase